VGTRSAKTVDAETVFSYIWRTTCYFSGTSFYYSRIKNAYITIIKYLTLLEVLLLADGQIQI
jgi:hypothetical protein